MKTKHPISAKINLPKNNVFAYLINLMLSNVTFDEFLYNKMLFNVQQKEALKKLFSIGCTTVFDVETEYL